MDGSYPIALVQAPAVSSSRSGRRHAVRVAMPMTAEIDRGHYPCLDWSISGCALDQDGPALPPNQAQEIRLHVEVDGQTWYVDSQAIVARHRQDGRALAFKFIDHGQTPLLDLLVQRWLSGGALPPSAYAGGRSPPALPPPPGLPTLPGPPATAAVPARVRLRHLFLILAGTAVVASVLAYLVASRLTVASDYAAVTGDLQIVRAAMDGVLEGSALRQGTRLHAGQVIGRVRPVVTPTTLAAARSALDVAQAKLDQQQRFLRSLQSGYEGFVTYAQHALSDTTAARESMDDQLAAEQRVYNRLHLLEGTGVVAPLRADQELVNLRTQQHALMTAKADEAAARQRLEDARRGRFMTDGRSTQLAPADVARDLAVMVADRDRAAAALDALSASTPVVSPCDCVVTTVSAPDQTFVQLGNPVASMAVPGKSGVQVDALVPSGLMSFLHTGQVMRVFLGDRTEAVPGTLTTLNYNPANSGRVGLPDTLRTLNNYGLITVTVPDVQEVPVGTPAVVNATASPGMVVHHLPGVSTLLSAAAAILP